MCHAQMSSVGDVIFRPFFFGVGHLGRLVAYIHIRRTLSIGASVFGYIDDFDDKLTRTMGHIIYSHGIFDRFVGTAHRIVRLHVHSWGSLHSHAHFFLRAGMAPLTDLPSVGV